MGETRRRVGWSGFALVAQGIEQRFPKPCVAGSNPAGGTQQMGTVVTITAVGGRGDRLALLELVW